MKTHITIGLGHEAEDLVNEKLAKALMRGTAVLNTGESIEVFALRDEVLELAREFDAIGNAHIITAMDLRLIESISQQLLNWVAVRRGER